MPNTYTNIFDKIIDFENLYSAYNKAASGKRYRKDVLLYEYKIEENIIKLKERLESLSWQPQKFREFYVYDPKKRLIQAPLFEDRIVHHAIVNIIEPLFERKFIFDSYACRVNKGTHKAVQRILKFERKFTRNDKRFYVLKGDISKYFLNINHDVLRGILKRTITCNKTISLINKVIDATNSGMPIGALTSQLFANVYLDQLDHFAKEMLGLKFYVRYMDDFIILHEDKEYLKRILSKIKFFVEDHLKLNLNKKTQIFPYTQGINFCGYRIWPTHLLPRKRTVKKFKKNIKRMQYAYSNGNMDLNDIRPRIMSFLGYIKHCNGYKTTSQILLESKFCK